MSLPNGDRGRDLNEPIEHCGCRLRDTGCGAVCECLRTTCRDSPAAGFNLAGPGDNTQGNRCSEYFEIMVVDLVLQSFGSGLIESLELVEINRVAIRHDHSVKHNGHAALLPKSCRSDLSGFAEHDGAFRDQHVLAVVRVDRVGNEHFHRSRRVAIEPIHQNCIQRCSLIDHIWFSRCRVNVDFRFMLVLRRGTGRSGRIALRTRRKQIARRLFLPGLNESRILLWAGSACAISQGGSGCFRRRLIRRSCVYEVRCKP